MLVLRPGVAIGILVLDPVHRSSQHRHVNRRFWSIVERCDAVLVDLELGHVPTVARDGSTQAARHGPKRLVVAAQLDSADRHHRADRLLVF